MSNVFDNEECRDWLKGLLNNGEATVKFIKADGSDRLMRCTLQESVLPKVDKTVTKTRKVSDETLSVWDLDANGWRSFRWDSIKEVSFG